MPGDTRAYSQDGLNESIESARFWADHMQLYSDWMQTVNDRYAIAAALISAVTGLAIWGTISHYDPWAQLATSAMAFAAAAAAIIPKIRGYGDCALKAAPLSAEYGHSLGELENALEAVKSNLPRARATARQAVKDFEAVKAKKDALRPYPRKLQDHMDAQRAKAAQVAPQPSGSTTPAGG
ncbi:MAG: hypothetical protein ABSE70_10540 [Candidatus Limnocylindrales bacterium]